MTRPDKIDPNELARLRPDTAQWVDLRGFLLSERCIVFSNRDPATGFIVCPTDFAVAVVAGEPTAEIIRAVTQDAPSAAGTAWAGEGSENKWHLLAPPESLNVVAAALGSWKRRDVTLHTRVHPSTQPKLPENIHLGLASHGWEMSGWNLNHLPEALRNEYETPWVRQRPVVAAFADHRPVAFCYAAVQTESLWDVAVDTLPDHRRGGLASACFTALSGYLGNKGLAPVWGCLDENEASMKMAARLGFRPAARLTSFVR